MVACMALQACTTPPPAPSDRVDSASASIDQVLKRKGSEKLIGPETAVPAPVYGDRTTVSFLGDASTLLANAAKGAGSGWTFSVTGPQPHLPIYVQINVKNVSFAEFLLGVAEQLGQRADIEVDGQNIKLRYRSHD